MLSLRWVLLSVILALEGCAATVKLSDCTDPQISNVLAPTSHIVILPYRYSGSNSAQQEGAREINDVLAVQAVRLAADMGNTNITIIKDTSDDPNCDISSIYDKIVENPTVAFWRRLRHSAVFIWGDIYDGPNGLIVWSHVRLFWNASDDRELTVTANQPFLSRQLRFTGTLPEGTISFPVNHLPSAQLDAIHEFRKGLVHTAQDESSETVEFPRKFGVGRWNDPWLEVIDFGGPTKWLWVPRAFADVKSLMPEMGYARALTAYLNYRLSGEKRALDDARWALIDFRGQYQDSGDPLLRVPLAMAGVLEGAIGLSLAATGSTARGDSSSEWRQALAEAAVRLPNRADVLNLAAIARIPGCCGEGAANEVVAIQRDLERAYRLDPGDLYVATNLLRWYELVLRLPADRRPLPEIELERRRQALGQVLGMVPSAL